MSDDLKPNDQADVKEKLLAMYPLRDELVADIRRVAGRYATPIAAKLELAATRFSTSKGGVAELLSEAAAMANNGGGSSLPIVQLEPPQIEYGDKVYQVEGDHALAFAAMVNAHPDRIGLSEVIGAQPGRKMDRLPAAHKAIVDTKKSGSRLTCPS